MVTIFALMFVIFQFAFHLLSHIHCDANWICLIRICCAFFFNSSSSPNMSVLFTLYTQFQPVLILFTLLQAVLMLSMYTIGAISCPGVLLHSQPLRIVREEEKTNRLNYEDKFISETCRNELFPDKSYCIFHPKIVIYAPNQCSNNIPPAAVTIVNNEAKSHK